MPSRGPAPPLPPRKMPTYVADLAARLSKLRNIMSILKEDQDNLKFVAYLVQRRGRYCQTCSRKRKPGGCGPTCPLLRPEPVGEDQATLLWRLRLNGGIQNILEKIRLYDVIAYDLERCGDNISLYELKDWEHLTNRWFREGLNLSYQMGDEPMAITYEFGKVDFAGVEPRNPELLADEEYSDPCSPTDTRLFFSNKLTSLQDDESVVYDLAPLQDDELVV